MPKSSLAVVLLFSTVFAAVPSPIPAPSAVTPAPVPSTQVSVLRDATYVVPNVSCAGKAGNCPKKGDVAVGECHKGLKSYVDGKCVAPIDATCVAVKGDKWYQCQFIQTITKKSAPQSSASCVAVGFAISAMVSVLL